MQAKDVVLLHNVYYAILDIVDVAHHPLQFDTDLTRGELDVISSTPSIQIPTGECDAFVPWETTCLWQSIKVHARCLFCNEC